MLWLASQSHMGATVVKVSQDIWHLTDLTFLHCLFVALDENFLLLFSLVKQENKTRPWILSRQWNHALSRTEVNSEADRHAHLSEQCIQAPAGSVLKSLKLKHSLASHLLRVWVLPPPYSLHSPRAPSLSQKRQDPSFLYRVHTTQPWPEQRVYN